MMFKIKGYDKYQKVNMELEISEDVISLNNRSSRSYGTSGNLFVNFHSDDIEDYQLARFTDLDIDTINFSMDNK